MMTKQYQEMLGMIRICMQKKIIIKKTRSQVNYKTKIGLKSL